MTRPRLGDERTNWRNAAAVFCAGVSCTLMWCAVIALVEPWWDVAFPLAGAGFAVGLLSLALLRRA